MSEDEKWSLEMKMIAYRRQLESQISFEKELEGKLRKIRQEKSELYQETITKMQNNFSHSLPFTIPFGFINMFLMKSILIMPITILSGALFINKIRYIGKYK